MTEEEKYARQTDLLLLQFTAAALQLLEIRRAEDFDGIGLIIKHIDALAEAEQALIAGVGSEGEHE